MSPSPRAGEDTGPYGDYGSLFSVGADLCVRPPF